MTKNLKLFRAARAFVGWSRVELAAKANIGLATLQNFEAGAPSSSATERAIKQALTDGGVIFTADGGLDSAEALWDRYILLQNPTPEQKGAAVIAAGILRRAGGRRAMPEGTALKVIEAARLRRNEVDQDD